MFPKLDLTTAIILLLLAPFLYDHIPKFSHAKVEIKKLLF